MSVSANLRKSFLIHLQKCSIAKQLGACYSTAASSKSKKKPTQDKNLEAVGKSLAAKGFLRPNKPYRAPENASSKISDICRALEIPSAANHKLADLEVKFAFLNACFKDFQHSVPNSLIHELETVGDVINFYECSVNTTVPYEALKEMDLPENLHIQYEYLRFNPEKDTKFNGKTAFPKSSTLVTGLKYREQYEGHEAKRSWP